MKKLRVTVDGKSYEVTVEVLDDGKSGSRSRSPESLSSSSVTAPVAPSKPKMAPAGNGDVLSPMSGSIMNINVKVGEDVKSGDVLIVLEAMKMETPIHAPQDGKVVSISATAGKTVEEGQLLLKLES